MTYPGSDFKQARTFRQAGRTLALNSSVNKDCSKDKELVRQWCCMSECYLLYCTLCSVSGVSTCRFQATCRRSSTRALHLCGLNLLAGASSPSLDMTSCVHKPTLLLHCRECGASSAIDPSSVTCARARLSVTTERLGISLGLHLACVGNAALQRRVHG